MARPSKYNSKLALDICRQLADGQSLRQICDSENMPHRLTVLRWASDPNHEFCDQYARAREVQADLYADQIIEIADSAEEHTVNIAKIRIDARKWIASKLKPKSFSEVVSVPIIHESQRDPELLKFTTEELIEMYRRNKQSRP